MVKGDPGGAGHARDGERIGEPGLDGGDRGGDGRVGAVPERLPATGEPRMVPVEGSWS
ncbi:hypothetical protein [Streptomyces sp. NPDC088760]|uniref:hypothetical protein n=1 Tax=Streptomyces sp. NPDC088760 TaxID=3365890 RepID=UPI00382CDD47